ncbi:MAG: DUF4347 domain-containing protein, partial [Methyloglobulus sp.]
MKKYKTKMRLALESRLLFDGAIAATADSVVDDKASQSAEAGNASQDISHDAISPDANLFTVKGPDGSDLAHQTAIVFEATSLGADSAPVLIIADAKAEGLAELIKNPPINAQIKVLDSKSDGYQQIAGILQARGATTEIRILTAQHGGKQWLATNAVNPTMTSSDQNHIADWGDGLTKYAQITVYGQQDVGQHWLHQMSALSGANVKWTDSQQVNVADDLQKVSAVSQADKTGLLQTSAMIAADFTAQLAVSLDTDNDGVDNATDLDDDNDGILDANELTVITPVPTAAPTDTGAPVAAGPATVTYTKSGLGDIILYDSTGGADIPAGATTNELAGFDLLYAGSQLTNTFSPSTKGITFSVADLDAEEHIVIQAYDEAGVLIDDITPYIVYTNRFATITGGSSTQSALLSTSLSNRSELTFNANAHVDLDITRPVSKLILTTISTVNGSAEFYITRILTDLDADGDGIINSLDLDSDNDGISDLIESGQPATVDTDNNGIVDGAINPQGVQVAANTATPIDTDNDGIADYRDLDSDNDGISDLIESGQPATIDTDNNGVVDGAINTQGRPLAAITVTPIDTDNDGVVDYRDLDSDNDGIADTVEARPTAGYVPNDGDVSNNDSDEDGIINIFDNNDGTTGLFGGTFTKPVNTDGTATTGSDNTPDYLDTDSDGDGKLDAVESGLTPGADTNNDGIGDGVIPITIPAYTDPDGIIANNTGASPSTTLENGRSDTAEVAYREINLPPLLDLNSAATTSDSNRGNAVPYNEGDNPVAIANTTLADVNENGEADITALKIVASGIVDGAAEIIRINGQSFPLSSDKTITTNIGGTTVQIVYLAASGSFTITNSAGATTPIPQTILDTLVRGITYQNIAQAPVTGNRQLTFTATDAGGLTSSDAVATIRVNDRPTATPVTLSGSEDTSIPVNLAGTDIDGTIKTLTVTALPPAGQGILYLADGKTPVKPNQALTPEQ